MPQTLLTPAALVLILAACGMPLIKAVPPALPKLPDEPALSTPNEQYHVYSVVLRQLTPHRAHQLAVVDSTLRGPDLRGLDAVVTGRDRQPAPPELDSLSARLEAGPPLFRVQLSGLQAGLPVRLVGIDDSVVVQRDEYGVIGLSPVVFNADSTRALVYIQVKCGPLCGQGELVLLARRPGRVWVIWHERELWVS